MRIWDSQTFEVHFLYKAGVVAPESSFPTILIVIILILEHYQNHRVHTICITLLGTSVYSEIAAAAAKLHQSCPTLCNPIDGSPPGSSVPGILQARTLEWVAISFSNAWKWKVKVKSLSRIRLSATPWTVAHQAPPSMGFSWQEYWSGLPLPSPSEIKRAQKIGII